MYRSQRGEEFVQPLHRIVDAGLHSGLNHSVPILDRLEDGVLAQ